MKDILITESKNNISDVIPQTKKAKKVFEKEIKILDKSKFSISKRDAIDVISWAISHNLSVDSKIPVIVKPKEIVR